MCGMGVVDGRGRGVVDGRGRGGVDGCGMGGVVQMPRGNHNKMDTAQIERAHNVRALS